MKLDALDHPKTLDLAARLNVELPNGEFMDLAAYPFLPIEDRVRRLEGEEWSAIKNFVHEANGWQCVYCGCETALYAVCDHVIPLARGGTNDPTNLVTSCNSCNSSKGMLTVYEFYEKLRLVGVA